MSANWIEPGQLFRGAGSKISGLVAQPFSNCSQHFRVLINLIYKHNYQTDNGLWDDGMLYCIADGHHFFMENMKEIEPMVPWSPWTHSCMLRTGWVLWYTLKSHSLAKTRETTQISSYYIFWHSVFVEKVNLLSISLLYVIGSELGCAFSRRAGIAAKICGHWHTVISNLLSSR